MGERVELVDVGPRVQRGVGRAAHALAQADGGGRCASVALCVCVCVGIESGDVAGTKNFLGRRHEEKERQQWPKRILAKWKFAIGSSALFVLCCVFGVYLFSLCLKSFVVVRLLLSELSNLTCIVCLVCAFVCLCVCVCARV